MGGVEVICRSRNLPEDEKKTCHGGCRGLEVTTGPGVIASHRKSRSRPQRDMACGDLAKMTTTTTKTTKEKKVWRTRGRRTKRDSEVSESFVPSDALSSLGLSLDNHDVDRESTW